MEENLKEKLFNKRENGWDTVDTRKKEAIFSFTKDYMNCSSAMPQKILCSSQVLNFCYISS